MISRGFRAVLFDWDGTLVDSAEATFRSYVALFAEFGIDFDRTRFGLTYSPDWRRTYRAVGLAEDRWAEADKRWILHYTREKTGLLPGARPALERLNQAGLLLGLVTSGDRGRVTEELVELDVHRFFGAVVCGGDLPMKKPRPEPLLHALEHLRVIARDAAYVGDSPEDVQMTRAAGAFSVGIPGGFPNHDALAASAPDAQAETLEAAAALLLRQAPGSGLAAAPRRG